MTLSRLRQLSAVCALLLAFTAACSTVIAPASTAAPPTSTTAPASLQDNPTAAAQRRATRQAQSTANALATQGPSASQTAAVAAKASQTADALSAATAAAAVRATTQAIYTAEHTWPQRIQESFADNQLGWPTGLTQDQYLAVTTTVAGGRYQWLTAIAGSGAYTNLAPSKEQALTDFYAAVSVQFVQGNDDGRTAYGLAFRLVDQDFGFFGILKSGSYLAMEVHNSNVDQNVLDTSPVINTGPGATNRIAVVGIGSDFVCLVNDEPVADIGANLGPGQVGLGVEAVDPAKPAQVDFTNFEVRSP